MRSLMMSPVVAMVVMTLAATGHADINASKTAAATRPKIELAPTVKVTSFRRPLGNGASYTGGPLALAVDVENTGNGPTDVTVKIGWGNGAISGLLTVPAHSTRYIALQDTEGLPSSCSPKSYTVSLTGADGAVVGTRSARITPSCTFTSTLEETWNQMTPDSVEAQKKGNAYLQSLKIVSQAACGKPAPSMKVQIINHATASSPSLVVQEKEWSAAAPVKAQTSAAFPLASNESKEVLLTPVAANASAEPPAKLHLAIVDWTKSLGGHTSDGGIFVNTSRSCSLDLDLL